MMATFNILGFDQIKIMSIQQEKQINLNGNDLIVLRNMVDMIEGNRLESKDIDNKSYTWIKYSLLVENLIFVSDKEDTFKKIVSKLVKCTLLERQVVKSVGNGAYTYFRKTELLESIMYKEESQKAKKAKKNTYKKKDQVEKVEVLEGQITVEEALQQEEKTDIEKIVEATGCTIERAEDTLSYSIACNKDNTIGFSIKAINENWKLKNKDTNGINPKGFNNFPAREYDYDDLERKLLGWENTDLEEVEETQESTGYDFLKKYGIGSAIAN